MASPSKTARRMVASRSGSGASRPQRRVPITQVRWGAVQGRALALLCFALASAPVKAAESPIARALRAQDWQRAATVASGIADPLAGELVTWLRLLRGGGAGEVEAFIARHPDWPNQAGLRHRVAEALAATASATICPESCLPGLPYADAAAGAAAAAALRQLWISGVQDAADEQAFLRRWSGALDPLTSSRRFARLVWQDGATAAALRQATRLGADAAAPRAWAALRQNAPDAPLRLALDGSPDLPPYLQLERLAWERRGGQLDAAIAGWRMIASATEQQHADAFWAERDRLARALLAAGRNAEALQVVSAAPPRAAPSRAPQALLAGWILLRRLARPAEAGPWFDRLAALSHGIGIAEAQYWRGRAAAAAGDTAGAATAWRAAAAWPTTFAGQNAARALGEDEAALRARIVALHDPVATPAAALALASGEFGRAAEWLVAWDETPAARGFLRRLDGGTSPVEQALVASLALRLGLPDVAVAQARQAGRRGVVLASTGWPRPYAPPASSRDPALVLAVMRQESSFDPGALSPAGARGLMQLMQPTAAALARQAGLALPNGALIEDPPLNALLGSLYLDQLLARFDQPALAAAAYNAGPHRVAGWLAGSHPRNAPELIDWIMMLPFEETRIYVQRVLETRTVYEAKGQ